MNNLKVNPVGLDAIIDVIQKKVYTLQAEWGIELDGYHRCYILYKQEGQTVEAFLGDNEYSNALSFAEGNKFFFVAPNDIEYVSFNQYETDIELYFILDVVECKPSILHRADEEVRQDVIKILERIPQIKVNRIIWQVDRVFNRFRNKQSRSYDYDIMVDIHPKHAFKIELKVLPYKLDQQIC